MEFSVGPPGAYSLLQMCSPTIETRRFFYMNIWPKILTSKALEEQVTVLDSATVATVDILPDLERMSREARGCGRREREARVPQSSVDLPRKRPPLPTGPIRRRSR